MQRVAHLDWNGLDLVDKPAVATPEVIVPEFGPLPDIAPSKTISPSELAGAKVLPGDVTEDDEDAKERGTVIHLLLEHLPRTAPADRAGLGYALVPTDPTLTDSVIRLLDQPALGHLWADDALTEVPVTADLPPLGRIHGTIDRLILTPTTVLAVDYKTNRIVPDNPAQTPLGVLRQQAVYDAALRQVFPDRQITVAILWTATAELMVLPETLLHETMTGLATA